MAAGVSGGKSEARQLSATWSGRFPPGIAQLTASNMRIQRSANWLMETPARQDLPDLLHRFQADVVVHSGKSFAYVKGFAMTIEIAVIIGSEGGLGIQFAGQHTAGERYTGEDSHLFLLGPREEYFGGALPEAVEDDLHCLNIGKLDRLERFFHFLDTDPVVSDFACLDHDRRVSRRLQDLRKVRWVDNEAEEGRECR